MTTSNVKRLRNEMKLFERESDRYIPSEKYYLLNIFPDVYETKDLRVWGKRFLTRNVEHQPLSTYVFGGSIIFVFSCLEEGEEHFKSGSYSQIISHYASLMGSSLKCTVSVNIVEFETRTQILTYLSWRVHENSKMAMITYSKNELGPTDIRNQTQKELVEKLDSVGVNWESVEPSEKYGIFYKLRKKKGKIVISSMSESFDARDTRKYSMFVFGS